MNGHDKSKYEFHFAFTSGKHIKINLKKQVMRACSGIPDSVIEIGAVSFKYGIQFSVPYKLMINSRTVRLACHVPHTQDKMNSKRILVRKPEGMRSHWRRRLRRS
jgi:hypothetical protein